MNPDTEYFLSINDVSKRLDIPAHTLRYWEKQFPVAVKPTTGAGGRRYYRGETVAALQTIKDLLYNHGMTIAGVRKLIKDGNLPTVDAESLMTLGATDLNPATLSNKSRTDTVMPSKSEIAHVIQLLEMAKKELKTD